LRTTKIMFKFLLLASVLLAQQIVLPAGHPNIDDVISKGLKAPANHPPVMDLLGLSGHGNVDDLIKAGASNSDHMGVSDRFTYTPAKGDDSEATAESNEAQVTSQTLDLPTEPTVQVTNESTAQVTNESTAQVTNEPIKEPTEEPTTEVTEEATEGAGSSVVRYASVGPTLYTAHEEEEPSAVAYDSSEPTLCPVDEQEEEEATVTTTYSAPMYAAQGPDVAPSITVYATTTEESEESRPTDTTTEGPGGYGVATADYSQETFDIYSSAEGISVMWILVFSLL
jgi:hypothetical protein